MGGGGGVGGGGFYRSRPRRPHRSGRPCSGRFQSAGTAAACCSPLGSGRGSCHRTRRSPQPVHQDGLLYGSSGAVQDNTETTRVHTVQHQDGGPVRPTHTAVREPEAARKSESADSVRSGEEPSAGMQQRRRPSTLDKRSQWNRWGEGEGGFQLTMTAHSSRTACHQGRALGTILPCEGALSNGQWCLHGGAGGKMSRIRPARTRVRLNVRVLDRAVPRREVAVDSVPRAARSKWEAGYGLPQVQDGRRPWRRLL